MAKQADDDGGHGDYLTEGTGVGTGNDVVNHPAGAYH